MMKKRQGLTWLKAVVTSLFGLAAAAAGGPAVLAADVVVYSTRDPQLIAPVLRAIEAETELRLKLVYAKSGLVDWIAAEGADSTADLLLTAEFGDILTAKSRGITEAIPVKAYEQAVPLRYRDPDGHWVGLATHARVVFAAKARVSQTDISYEDLADPKWRGRLCMRDFGHTYNLSLIASMIAYHGREWAKRWLEGVKANVSGKLLDGDRAQLQAVFDGRCDLALVNSYYLGATFGAPATVKPAEMARWSAEMKVIFPNRIGRGSHVTASAVALIRTSKNKANAVRVIQALASSTAQQVHAAVLYGYPVVPGIRPSDLVGGWGDLQPDSLPLSEIARLRGEASAIAAEVAAGNGSGL